MNRRIRLNARMRTGCHIQPPNLVFLKSTPNLPLDKEPLHDAGPPQPTRPVHPPRLPRTAVRGRAARVCRGNGRDRAQRSEEHTSELQSLMRTSYAVFCLKTKQNIS